MWGAGVGGIGREGRRLGAVGCVCVLVGVKGVLHIQAILGYQLGVL